METSDINRNDDSVKIIAEAGINHNGDLDLAMRLVDAAKAAGADVVKFQTGNASASITKYANTADYQKDSTGSDQQLAMIEQLELPFAAYIDIKDYCDEVRIEFATTFFDKDAAYYSLQNLDLRFCQGCIRGNNESAAFGDNRILSSSCYSLNRHVHARRG